MYCCYVVYLDHHFTVIYFSTSVCLVITSTLCTIVFVVYVMYPDHHIYCNILLLHCCTVYRCYVMYPDHHYCNHLFRLVNSSVCLVITSTLFYLYACTSRSSLYCNIPSDLCSLCLSCYYFYIVLYCFMLVYLVVMLCIQIIITLL